MHKTIGRRLSEKNKKIFYMDQDVLNLTLRGDIFFIDNSWNFQWQYLWRLHTIPDQYRQEYVKCAERPRIMHYAGDKKPWERPDLEMADIFGKQPAIQPVMKKYCLQI